MAEYRLTPAAVRDLQGIWRNTRRKWGLQQALLYTDRLVAAFAGIAEAPLSAPACDHIRAGYRRRLIQRHVIYFRLADDGVAIVRILHGRMDVSRHL